MENLSWIFDGIGTELISLVVGLAAGGIAGYKIGIKKSGLQKQKAKDRAKQKQVFDADSEGLASDDDVMLQQKVRQSQKAGHDAQQIQIGSARHGK